MTQDFLKAFDVLIGIEKGYVNDPTDAGGETKYGISKRSYPHIDIKNLSLEKAKLIYYEDFWRKLNLDGINDYSIKLELFDTSVNMGQRIAGEFLQQSINLMNRNQTDFKDIEVDGKIVKETLTAYYKVDKKTLLKALNGFQFMRYVEICRNKPSQEKFFHGWLTRVNY